MEYKIIRHHKRKNLLITVNPMREVTVKAGLRTTDEYIENFVKAKTDWIIKQQKYFENKYHHRITVNKEQLLNIKKELLPQMAALVQRYAEIMGVEAKGVKITSAEKRWGSCSSKNTICFSYRCAFLSQKCKEYIVIHELSHISEFNHSKKFYDVVERYMPDYKSAEKELDGYYIHLQK